MSDEVRARADALVPLVADHAEEGEAARRLVPDLVGPLADAGLFRMAVPAALGGPECHPAEMVEAIESISRGDGAAGWCVMIGSTTSVLAAYLPEADATEIYGPPEVVTGGAFAPSGRAKPAPGGHAVTGRWAWASGCQHCAWLVGGCVVLDGDKPRCLPNGSPDVTLYFFPADDVEIIDTWHTSGLRGTGSHDIAVDGLEVAPEQSVSLFTGAPRHDGPLYRFPVFGLLALGIGAVALGIARASIDDLAELAGTKTPTFQTRTLGQRAEVHAEVARAEADLRAARALVMDAIGRAWTAAESDAVGEGDRTGLRLAATHATTTAARVVDTMYTLGGGTAVRAESPLQRRFRDVHAATQHLLVAPPTWEVAGRSLLGLDPGTPGW